MMLEISKDTFDNYVKPHLNMPIINVDDAWKQLERGGVSAAVIVNKDDERLPTLLAIGLGKNIITIIQK